MDFSKGFRIFWWLFLWIGITIFLSFRFDLIVTGKTSPFDVFFFLLWILLSFAPLFNEIQLFGIKMKKEINETKKQLEDKIQNVQNSLMAVSQNQTINFPAPSSENVLNEILERLNAASSLPQQSEVQEAIPDVNARLFSYRFKIEQETKRILETRLDYQPQKYFALSKMLDELKKSGLLEGNVFMGIREIIAICNNAIHDEGLSESQINFADTMAPRIIETLKGL